MRKYLILLLILLARVVYGTGFVFDGPEAGIICTGSGSSTEANTRISAYTGNYFIWLNGVNLSTSIGCKITITDGGAKKLVGIMTSAGPGETEGSDLLNGFGFTSGFTLSGFTATSNALTRTGTGDAFAYKASVLTTNKLYKATLTVTGTTMSFIQTDLGEAGIYIGKNNANKYFTALDGYAMLESSSGPSSDTATVTVWTNQEVTAPPATAAMVIGGWTKDSGFTFNDARNYTYAISAP